MTEVINVNDLSEVILTVGLLGAVIPSHLHEHPETWNGIRFQEIEQRILAIEERLKND